MRSPIGIVGLIFLSLSFIPASETRLSKPDEWVTQSFQVPWDISTWDSPNADTDFKSLPSLPKADASEGVWIDHIRNNTKRILESKVFTDMEFPVGSAFLLDSAAGTLAVRTTAQQMAQVNSVINSVTNGSNTVPRYVAFHLHLIQADATMLRQILRETENKADHTEQWKRLSAMVDQKKVKALGTLALQTRSGQRARLESTSDHPRSTGFTVDEKGNLEVKRESRSVGLKVEIDPVLGPNNDTIDINYALEYPFAPPVERHEALGLIEPLGQVEATFTDFRCAKITTAITILNGMTRLLGTWKPFGTPELDGADVLQAAFMTAEIVQNRSAENKTLAAKLKALADKAVPITAMTSNTIEESKATAQHGMLTRDFKVPPDFVSSPIPPSDPFSDSKSVITREGLNPKAILEQNGIKFPDGSSCVFIPATALLRVTNTPENLENVKAFLDGIIYCGPGRLISSTLHVLQAEGPVLLQLLQQTSGIADHKEVWQKAEDLVNHGKATILSSQRLDTRSGQRCLIEAVEEHYFLKRLAQDDKHRMVAEYEMRPVGTRLEIDPVLGSDGYTIDLNLAPEFHHAPPTPPLIAAPSDGQAVRVQATAPVFHSSKLTTAITMASGMTRLLGVWKPEGKPEFDTADVLQAMFIHVEAVRMEREEPTASQPPK
jgi:hypothetical protein